ncbi:MAG: non-heme iron oxygenase ferredoxin subunit [Caldilineaceae bacterium]
MSDLIKVATVDELPVGGRKILDVDNVSVALFNIDGTIYAIEDRCTHDDGPLAEGELSGCTITCPRHGARFDVRSGKALSFPAFEPTNVYEVQLRGNEVWIESPV